MTTKWLSLINNGDYGLFVAPPGVDADTASPEELLLNVSENVAQLLLRGYVQTPFPRTVTLGFGVTPDVLLTTISFDPTTGNTGFARPWPNWGTSTYTASANGVDAFVTITEPSMEIDIEDDPSNVTHAYDKIGYQVIRPAA